MDAVCNLQQLGLESSVCSFHVRGVLKRWATDTGVLTQFACVTEWPTGTSLNYVTEEFAWSVALSGADPPRRSAVVRDSAHMRSSIESTLVSPSATRRSSIQAHRKLIDNTVLPSVIAMIKRMDQVIENALLDSARAASARIS
jgi:hypothetical protein